MPGCEAAKRLEQPFLALAAAINDTLSSASRSPLEDRDFGSGLMLATDSPGHNSQPDVCGAGLQAFGGWLFCFVCGNVWGAAEPAHGQRQGRVLAPFFGNAVVPTRTCH